jgi:uncharacterized protein (DUF3820 family)
MLNLNDSRSELIELANARMPFGKHKDVLLIKIPESYLLWMKKEGFPNGKLGKQLALMLEIKCNGLEELIYPLVKK